MLNGEQQEIVKGVLLAMEERLRSYAPGQPFSLPSPVLSMPAPVVKNEFAPEVTIDIAAFVEAVNRMAEAVIEMTQAVAALQQSNAIVLEKLAEKTAFNPTINVPKNDVKVQATIPAREKRSVEVTHSDGTKAIIREL